MAETGAGPLLTAGEVGKWLRCSPKTVTRWAQAGRLHCVRTPGGHRRYYQYEIEAIVRGGTWEPPGGWPEAA